MKPVRKVATAVGWRCRGTTMQRTDGSSRRPRHQGRGAAQSQTSSSISSHPRMPRWRAMQKARVRRCICSRWSGSSPILARTRRAAMQIATVTARAPRRRSLPRSATSVARRTSSRSTSWAWAWTSVAATSALLVKVAGAPLTPCGLRPPPPIPSRGAARRCRSSRRPRSRTSSTASCCSGRPTASRRRTSTEMWHSSCARRRKSSASATVRWSLTKESALSRSKSPWTRAPVASSAASWGGARRQAAEALA
mmetsp:Transcript_6469/g.18527  ORF Transcript_6469/g.18527 Transcript_6469/m.18527 type:complete len:252 (+) Transcript_6469:241-996(+)